MLNKGKDLGTLCKNHSALLFLSYEEIEHVTRFFNENNQLGDGAFNFLILGNIWYECLVEVKRIYHDHSRRVEQFW